MFIDKEINEYINGLLCIKQDDWLSELEEYAQKNDIPIISKDVKKFLETIVSIAKPVKILELGTAIGYSSLVMAKACESIERIDTIEISYELALKAKKNIKQKDFEDKINIIYADANDVLKNLTELTYDFVFIDAAKGQYHNYLQFLLNIVKDNGIIFADNVLFKGIVAKEKYNWRKNKQIYNSLRDFLNAISTSNIMNTSILSIGDGVSISYINRKREDI